MQFIFYIYTYVNIVYLPFFYCVLFDQSFMYDVELLNLYIKPHLHQNMGHIQFQVVKNTEKKYIYKSRFFRAWFMFRF